MISGSGFHATWAGRPKRSRLLRALGSILCKRSAMLAQQPHHPTREAVLAWNRLGAAVARWPVVSLLQLLTSSRVARHCRIAQANEESPDRATTLPHLVRTRSQLEVRRTTASTEELAPRLQARTSGRLPISARSGHLAATRPRRSLVPPLSEGPSTGAPRHSRNIRPELLGQKPSSRDCQIKSESAPSTRAVARDRRLAPPGCSGRLVRPMQDRSHFVEVGLAGLARRLVGSGGVCCVACFGGCSRGLLRLALGLVSFCGGAVRPLPGTLALDAPPLRLARS